MAITVYSKPDNQCVQCKMTKGLMRKEGIEYESIDITLPENEHHFNKILEMGYLQVPVVIDDTDPNKHWSGFQPDKIKSLAA